MHGAKAALIRMNSLTAQLRSDHGKLISRLLFLVCQCLHTERDFIIYSDREIDS